MFFMFVKLLIDAVLVTAIFALISFIYGAIEDIYKLAKGVL